MHSKTLMAIALGFLSAGTAHAAADIVTAALPAGTADSAVCRVVNAGKQPATVTVTILSTAGVVRAPSVPPPVDPGKSASATDPGPVDSYCRITGISKRQARVSYCMLDAGGNCTAVVTAP